MSWSLNNLWAMGLNGLNYYEVVSGGGLVDSLVTIEFSSHLAMEMLTYGTRSLIYQLTEIVLSPLQLMVRQLLH